MKRWNSAAKSRIRTGDTRLLKGWGGKIGITMRSITKAEDIKDKKASTRAGMRGIILVV